MNRPPLLALTLALALVALIGAAGCGSVTAKHSDGGGTGGSHADSSTKTDGLDAKTEDARRDSAEHKDAVAAADMRKVDARAGDDTRTSDARVSDARTDAPMSLDSKPDSILTGGNCSANSDCTLYSSAGSGCCGVCQPKNDPAPPVVDCLVACLTPYKTCNCVSNQCTGSKAQL
jgi:hypothetical protein